MVDFNPNKFNFFLTSSAGGMEILQTGQISVPLQGCIILLIAIDFKVASVFLKRCQGGDIHKKEIYPKLRFILVGMGIGKLMWLLVHFAMNEKQLLFRS